MIPIFYNSKYSKEIIKESILSLDNDFKPYIVYQKEYDKDYFKDLNVEFIDILSYFNSEIDLSRFFEVMIPSYIDFEKIVFLNPNLKINNLKEIFNLELNDFTVAADYNFDHYKLDLLIIDTKKYKSNHYLEKIIDFSNDYECEIINSFNEVIKDIFDLKLEIKIDDNYNMLKKLDNLNEDRVEIIKKIKDFEINEMFDIDVEEDPETIPLKPGMVDYECKKLKSKINARISVFFAHRFLNKLIKNKQIVINKTIGSENLKNMKTGCVMTCNHFNAFDSFAIHLAYESSKHHKQKFFRVIREGNYTSFPGFFGYLMRNCRTLPLSNNIKVMGEFMRGCSKILENNHFILIYPEQSMWWNYRKPKPLKPGGYKIAAKSNVPILPCFIGQRNTDVISPDGFYVQEYTVYMDEPIYAPNDLTLNQKMEYLMKENYKIWKKRYEDFYQLPLIYLTK